MDKEFGANIRTALHYYNINHAKLAQEKKVKKVLAEIEDLKDVIGKNIQLVLRQTADLEKMVKKSEQATESTLVFRKKATQVRNKLWRRHKASGCGLILSVALLIYIILAMTCGWGLTGCRVSQK
jgi:vesicle-associated membrane protein 7